MYPDTVSIPNHSLMQETSTVCWSLISSLSDTVIEKKAMLVLLNRIINSHLAFCFFPQEIQHLIQSLALREGDHNYQRNMGVILIIK